MGLLDSTVCTPFGFRKIRDLKVGDIISSSTTGGQQRIIQLHPIETHDFYRVHFIDGTHFDCSSGHLWQLHQSRGQTKKIDNDGNRLNERVWETRKMYEWMEKKKSGMYKGCNLIIPLCAPIQFTMTNMLGHPKSIQPYVLGALIGDGCITNSVINFNAVQLTSMDEEIVDMFRNAGYNMERWNQKKNNKAKSYTIHNSNLVQSLKEIGLAGCNSSQKFEQFSIRIFKKNNF